MKLPSLRRIREAGLLTQEELANKSGLSLGTVSRIENGHDASMKTTRKLAEALRVEARELTREEIPA
jgi:transcriptional regulator with XRE-family HTH domain